MFGQRRMISTPTSFPASSHRTEFVGHKELSISDFPVEKVNASFSSINTSNHFSNRPTNVRVTNASIIPGVGFAVGRASMISQTYNQQTRAYLDVLRTEQQRLTQRNDAFLSRVYSINPEPTVHDTRNYSDWADAKKLVVRDELMKLQIGGKTDLPLTDGQKADLATKLKGLDLSEMDDSQVNAIIHDLLHPNEQIYIDALKAFKISGKVDSCFQAGKLEQLQEYLQDVDLSKITFKEYKYIEDNFIEKMEIHHRTSVSTDPTKQSNMDNLDTLNTTQHDAKHTDPDTGKVNYRLKLSEESLDRKAELEAMNKKRVLNEKLTGLGVAVAIGLGTGFAIGFIVSLAQNGINSNSIKYAFISGAKQGVSSAGMAAGGYAIGSTVGAVAGKALTECVKTMIGANVAEETLKKISEVCNMGAAGALITVAFTVYEFAKLKRAGYTTKECLLRTGKSAALSFSVLIISMIAVGAGCPGIAVSIVAGVIMTGYSVAKIYYDKRVSNEVTLHSIELCKPVWCIA